MFDRFAERITRQVVRSWFFALVAVAVLAWLPTLFLWDSGASDLLVDALANPTSLLLLLLLQNSQHRSERAQDRRQDAIEHALALLLDEVAEHEDEGARRRELTRAAGRLRRQAEESSREASAALDDEP